ncbi:hypothetical protein Gasu2_65070 [Galdieria sulphuraria]|nr:hypothetical protein Gasu2_65070 [Galdieria sulphuraria]
MQSFWMPFHSAKCLFLLSLLVTTQGKSCIPSNIHFRPLGSPTRKLCNTTRWDKSCYSVKHKRQQRSTTNQVPSSSCVENSELPKHLVVKKLVPIPEIENIDQFVLFSDLHLRKDNLETCIQVLKQVHQVAYERNAGVLFLGDFWDRRGSLPVEPLNAAIEELQRWQQPLIMIPGNHDQVSYDGTVHSLLPIMVSLKHPAALVIDQPSIFLDALWIPFIREDDLFTKVISSVSPLWSQIDAVFCHTDIQGAQWIRNESHSSFNCTKGVLPDCFPSHVAVYSGHFHKPQQIPNTHIRYVGSPYQVSAMESGQQKYLLRLSRSHRWSVQETIPISLGPKHYYYHFGDILNISSLDFLQPGDRVFLQVNSDIPESQIAPILEQVRQQKASVFTFLDEPDKENSVSSIESENSPAELRDPIRILQQYGDVYKLSLSVMDVGKEIIQQVLASQEHASFDGQQSNSIDLVLDWVHIDGFGSFRDSVTYPLSNRGLVILTGENEDDITSTSNASGKTTLWMAALWCLTTCTTFCSHVIHDDRKEAQVTVYGRWNGHSLQVTRCIQRKRASHRLRIWLDGEEWTCQEIRATQQQLDRWIDTRLLSHCVFFGQHTFLYDLFASNDREWKEQLSRFIPLNIWEGCKHYVRNRLKTLDESILRLRSQIETTENWCKQLESRIEMQQMEYQRLLTRVHLRENDVLYSSHLDRMEHHTSHSVTSVPQRDHYDVLQQLNDRLQDIQEEIHDTKQRLYDLQHGITTIQQQIANHRNQYNYLECIEQQHDEWQQQYKRWKQQRDDRKKQIQSILKQKPTQQQFHEQLQRLQLQWDECQYEMKQKSRQCTQWEEEWTLGKPTGDRNGTKGAYLRWKQWELRYQRYQVEYSKVWNEKMVLQTQWEKVGGKEEDEWICDYCLQPVSPTHHKKALENLQRTYQLSVRREERMSKILNHIQHHMDQAKQEYQQLVYNSMAKAKQEINDIQIEKERIGEERNDVQQQIMQLKQLFKEWQQLDEEQSWKNHLIILLGQLLTEKKKKEEEEERVSSKSGISKESTYDVFN